jgi:hypothetical protein
MFSGIAWLRRPAGWARDGLLVTAGAVAVLGGFAGTPLQAAGETGTPSGSGGVECPASNPPNQMTLVAGTPQTAILRTAFATGFAQQQRWLPGHERCRGNACHVHRTRGWRERGVLHQRL